MVCARCGANNQAEFDCEVAIHVRETITSRHSPICIFPKVLVCKNCGLAEFTVPAEDLTQLSGS